MDLIARESGHSSLVGKHSKRRINAAPNVVRLRPDTPLMEVRETYKYEDVKKLCALSP